MKRLMTAALLTASLAALLVPSLAPSLAWARAMLMTDSHPKAQEMVDGLNAQYSVRFDGPVDHRQSLLSITGADGKAVSTMHPLLDAAPDVLFASGPRLAEGDYELHWVVRSIPDGQVSSGYVPFKVKK
jgi:methionine-rich copper-binding protein CopC